MTEAMAIIAVCILLGGFILTIAGVSREDKWVTSMGLIILVAAVFVGGLAYCMGMKYVGCI